MKCWSVISVGSVVESVISVGSVESVISVGSVVISVVEVL